MKALRTSSPSSSASSSAAPDRFESALRAGPPQVQPSTGFATRMENGWRRAALAEAPAPVGASWLGWLGAGTAPALAVLVMGLVCWGLLRQPGIEMPAPQGPAVATVEPAAAAVLLPVVPTLHPSVGEGLRALQEQVEKPYRTERELLVQDAAQALRFVAANFVSPEMLAEAEARGWVAPPRRGGV